MNKTLAFWLFTYCGQINAITYSLLEDSAKWEVKKSSLKCSLNHIIPKYGKISFINNAGVPLYLAIDVNYGKAQKEINAKVDFMPPPWLAKMPTTPLGFTFSFKDRNEAINIDTEYAQAVLNALEQGLVPTLSHKESSFKHELVIAQISPIKFQSNFKDFLACIDALPTVTFQQIEKTTLYFESGSVRLTPETQALLDNLVVYALEKDIRKIELAGYSDSAGGYEANRQLARARLEMVKKYLIQKGVPGEKVLSTVLGELSPIATNKTAAGRAKNRRVTIRLYH